MLLLKLILHYIIFCLCILFFRYDGVLLAYSQKLESMSAAEHKIACNSTKTARKHLKYLCDKVCRRSLCSNQNFFAGQAHTEILISVIRQRNKKPLEEFLLAFIQRTHNPSLSQEMAKLLLLLAGDAPISSAVPVRYHPHLLQTCTAIRNGEQVKQQLQDMKNYGIDLSNV